MKPPIYILLHPFYIRFAPPILYICNVILVLLSCVLSKTDLTIHLRMLVSILSYITTRMNSFHSPSVAATLHLRYLASLVPVAQIWRRKSCCYGNWIPEKIWSVVDGYRIPHNNVLEGIINWKTITDNISLYYLWFLEMPHTLPSK